MRKRPKQEDEREKEKLGEEAEHDIWDRWRNAVDYWAVYVPGNSTQIYPEGFGQLLRKESTLVFQMHYTPNGTEVKPQTNIGFRFAAVPSEFEVKTVSIVKAIFRFRRARTTISSPHPCESRTMLWFSVTSPIAICKTGQLATS